MKQDDRGAVCRTGLGIADTERPGIDPLHLAERSGGSLLHGLGLCRGDDAEFGGSGNHCGSADKPPAIDIDRFGDRNSLHRPMLLG
jgi:hypothetical protein